MISLTSGACENFSGAGFTAVLKRAPASGMFYTKMRVVCNKCQKKYKLKIKKRPASAVNFKCGKCGNNISISPDKISAAIDASSEKTSDKDRAATVHAKCSKCGNEFLKSAKEGKDVCYQCRIDSLVSNIREKYGTSTAGPSPDLSATGKEEPSKYTVRTADGLVLGPVRLRTVGVLAREKRIKGTEEVQKDEGDYQPLMSFPELAEFFPVLDEAMDTSGLEDKIDQAFMTAFGMQEDEEVSALAEATTRPTEPTGTDESISIATAEPPEPEREEQPQAAAKAPEPEGPEEPAEAAGPVEPEAVGEAAETAEAPVTAGPGEITESREPDEIPAPEQAEAPAPESGQQELEPPPEKEAHETRPEAEPAPETPDQESQTDIIDFSELRSSAEEEPGPVASEEQEPGEEPQEQVPAQEVGTEFDPVGEEEDEEKAGEPEEEEEDIIEDLEPIEEPPPDARYRIRYPDGLMLGPVKIDTIKELLQSGSVTGQEVVQVEDGPWMPFAEVPGFDELISGGDEEELIELTDAVEELS